MIRPSCAPLAVLVGALLACGFPRSEPAEPEPNEPGPSEPSEPAGAPDEPLEGYAYVPGPSGVDDARFSHPAPGDTIFVGVDEANLRSAPSAEADVVTTLALAAEVTVVAVGPEAVLIGRRNAWCEVRTSDGQQGWLFGAILTPLAGSSYFRASDEASRPWAVTFSPDFTPRLRVGTGADATSVDLVPTERFRGGRLQAQSTPHGDYEEEVQVAQCRLDGGEQPACSTAVARLGPDGRFAQVTPPDPWRLMPEPLGKISCERAHEVTPVLSTPRPLLQLQLPKYLRGGDGEVDCTRIGELEGRGALISCTNTLPGKINPDTLHVDRFVVEQDEWTYLPCASSAPRALGDLASALVEARRTIRIDATIALGGRLIVEDPLQHEGHIAHLIRRTPHLPEARRVLFEHPELGPIYTAESREPEEAGALYLPQPDGGALSYRWSPEATAPIHWTIEDPPTGQDYTSSTTSCSGGFTYVTNVETGVVPSDLEPQGSLPDGTVVYRLARADHPVEQRLFARYERLTSGSSGPPELTGGLEPGQLRAQRPWLFILDPWDRVVRLMRTDFTIPAMCEPILYVYADPPAEITIRPGEGLTWFKTLPHGPDGWSGLAGPDGSVIVDGQRHDSLFWEGRSVWFAPPQTGWVIRGPESEALLRDVLPRLGLRGHELEAFLDAWVPQLAPLSWVRIGFHDPDTIDQLAPLQLEPVPETITRVLMDASPLEAPRSLEPPRLWPVSPREGLTLIEWGGVLRSSWSPLEGEPASPQRANQAL